MAKMKKEAQTNINHKNLEAYLAVRFAVGCLMLWTQNFCHGLISQKMNMNVRL